MRQEGELVVCDYSNVECSDSWLDLRVVQGDHKVLTWERIS